MPQGQAKKILLVTLEPIAKNMAGPAIRAVELARALCDEFGVTVYSPCPSDLATFDLDERANFQFSCALSKSRLYELAEQHEAIYLQANVLKLYPRLAKLHKYLILDLYDPYLFSVLAQLSDASPVSTASYRLMHKVLEQHLAVCDFSICASERQRDYWLGRYCSMGRLNPQLYLKDSTLRKLIDIVPFGVSQSPPVRSGPGIKGEIAGIGKEDFLLLWGGGIWDWFDPLTVIEAVAKVSQIHPQVKLFFMGIKSPNPQVGAMPMAGKAIRRAAELNVLDKNVFFAESWTPYEQRVNLLLDADVAVSAHFDVIETRFSFRTRLLDYFWAGLPVITTKGDQLADLIELKKAGYSVGYGDTEAWCQAISMLVKEQERKEQMKMAARQIAQELAWQKVCEPIAAFLRAPYHLPAHRPVRMPGLLERAHAVYARGGKELLLKRSKAILQDFIKH